MATPVPGPPQADALPRPAGRPGGVEERYRSLFVIGRGGMGAVEVALERGKTGYERVVALKRLLPEGARDVRHMEMFLREARLAALLSHPNVVHAFAFGELYGELFMAMEYLEGEPLSQVLHAAQQHGEGLDPSLVAFVLAQVCDGLHAAHELREQGKQGLPLHVVHRDVSPHNVMIAYDGHVKLLDFGVAKLENAGHESRTGEVKGKMAYMSPEQALGDKLDRRSDLFSIGAVLFECLTGQRMWGPGTDLEVMRKLALERPPRLDAAMPGAPRTLVDLQARLVAHEPQRRPATAKDVAQELRAFVRSCSAPVDSEAVGALMHRLFAAEAEAKRALLTESLAQAAPGHVEELRRTIEPQGGAEWPTSTIPVIVRAPAARARPAKKSRAGLLVASAVALVLVAIVVTSAAMRNSAPARPNEGPPNGVENPAVAVPGPAVGTATPTSTETATATAPPTANPAPSGQTAQARSLPLPARPFASGLNPTPTVSANERASSSIPVPSPAQSAAPGASASAAPNAAAARPRTAAPSPSLAAPKLPDVDPTPF